MESFIFVYGLLKSNYDNEPAKFIRSNCSLICSGHFSGTLFDLGTYPGAIYNAHSTSNVHGEIYKIDQNKEKLTQFLDNFEGVGTQFAQPNEYLRKIIPIHTKSGVIQASTYLYNWNVEGKQVIKNGNYENVKGSR